MFYPKSFLLFFWTLLIFDIPPASGIQCYFFKERFRNLTISDSSQKMSKTCQSQCVTFIVDASNFYLVGSGCEDDLLKSPIAIDGFHKFWKKQVTDNPSQTYWYNKWYVAAVCHKDLCNDRELFKGLLQNGKDHSFHHGKISDIIYNGKNLLSNVETNTSGATIASDAIRCLPCILMSLLMNILL